MPDTDPKQLSLVPDVDRLKREIKAKADELKVLRRLLRVAEDAAKMRAAAENPSH